jgi:endonuclease/exonuclease/phosphatase (EEP) superfamily protein YafD
MFSRHPMRRINFDQDPEDFERYKFVFALRRSVFIDSPAGRFLLTADHPSSPRTRQTWQRGNEAVRLLSEVCQRFLTTANVPIVIGGDFNSTPAGWRHRYIESHAGLKPSDQLGGLTGTWPSDWPGAFRLTIDRVWASPDIEFVDRQVLEDIGSDHRPILITLRLPVRPAATHSDQFDGEADR